MKIEVGKFYQTRFGLKAGIYSVTAPGEFCVHGYVENAGGCSLESWLSDGKYCANPDEMDLIAQWADPKPSRMKAWINSLGTVKMLGENQLPETSLWSRVPWLDEPEMIKIPTECTK